MIEWARRLGRRVKWALFVARYGRRLVALFEEAYKEVETLRYVPRTASRDPYPEELELTSSRKRVEAYKYINNRIAANPDLYKRKHVRRVGKTGQKTGLEHIIEKVWERNNPGDEPKSMSYQEVEMVIDPVMMRPVKKVDMQRRDAERGDD